MAEIKKPVFLAVTANENGLFYYAGITLNLATSNSI
jgi:hypothetical protein